MAAHRKYPKEMCDEVIREYGLGIPIETLVERFAMPDTTIRRLAQKAGVSRPVKRSEVANNQSGPEKRCSRCGRSFFPEDWAIHKAAERSRARSRYTRVPTMVDYE